MMKRFLSRLCSLLLLFGLAHSVRADMQFNIPPISSYMVDGNSFTSFLLDATGEEVAALVHMPKTGTLNTITLLTGTVTTWQNLRVSFQNVSASTGDPDGVQDQFRVLTGADTDDNIPKQTGIISSDGTDGGAKRSVTRGDIVMVVTGYDSTVGNLNIRHATGNISGSQWIGTSYVDHFTAAWAKNGGAVPTLAIEYTDGYVYTPGVYPISAKGNTSYHVDSAGADEYGNEFTVSVPTKTTGCYMYADLDGAADCVLYDAAMSSVASCTFDPDVRDANGNRPMYCGFTTEPTIPAATVYTIMLKPTTTTAVSLLNMSINTAAMMAMLPGGTAIYSTSRLNAGSKTNVTTTRYFIGIVGSSVPACTGGASSCVSIQ